MIKLITVNTIVSYDEATWKFIVIVFPVRLFGNGVRNLLVQSLYWFSCVEIFLMIYKFMKVLIFKIARFFTIERIGKSLLF